MGQPIIYHLGKFFPKTIHWEKLIPLIGPANAALARFDGTLAFIPNPQVLLKPLSTQEAVLSSRIEGTQATMGEVFEFEAGASKNKFTEARKGDIYEIINYRKAMAHAVQQLEQLPLCLRVIKESHQVLMQNVRGRNKSPGEFRKTPNWIGAPGCSIEEARFIPNSAEHLNQAMSAWETYLHADESDRLVQLAILHAEFEALHPFLDGNGRLGRMLIPLFLYHTQLLQKPVFYISAYFERNRDTYYEKLLSVSRDDDWTGFCIFFLEAILNQAKDNQEKATAILNLYKQKKDKITELTHSQYSIKVLDFLFCHPIFQSSDFISGVGIPVPTAKRLLKVLRDNDFFHVIQEAGGRRPALLAFQKLLNIVEGNENF